MWEFKIFVFEISFDLKTIYYFEHASKLHVIHPQIKWAYCIYDIKCNFMP
jgi:hypothetical protein